jgi:hypothetical protein
MAIYLILFYRFLELAFGFLFLLLSPVIVLSPFQNQKSQIRKNGFGFSDLKMP